MSDGTQWHVISDPAGDYSWFVTYIYRDEDLAKFMKTAPGKMNAVEVLRIRNDGKDGDLFGTR